LFQHELFQEKEGGKKQVRCKGYLYVGVISK
jgi:hypothetical protein